MEARSSEPEVGSMEPEARSTIQLQLPARMDSDLLGASLCLYAVNTYRDRRGVLSVAVVLPSGVFSAASPRLSAAAARWRKAWLARLAKLAALAALAQVVWAEDSRTPGSDCWHRFSPSHAWSRLAAELAHRRPRRTLSPATTRGSLGGARASPASSCCRGHGRLSPSGVPVVSSLTQVLRRCHPCPHAGSPVTSWPSCCRLGCCPTGRRRTAPGSWR